LHCYAFGTLKLYPNRHCKKYAKKTSLDLQKDLMHDVVHVSSSTVPRRLLEAGRKAKKSPKGSFSHIKNENKMQKILACRRLEKEKSAVYR